MKFGVYLSPWDRNSAFYGTPEYNDYYANQLTELLTEYGELFCVWQDNACGEGPNGKKQVYDFPRFNALIRQYQPDAFIFNDFGPDVRWCGNEAGTARPEEWAVVPRELITRSEGGVPVTPLREGGLAGIYNTDIDLGTLANISYSKELVFAPSEFDTSIRPGWFYHASESPRSVDELFDVYLRTVGGNGCLNLNVPPNRQGRFVPRDIETLRALGERIRT
jgi:alpha-L-fucosidase